MNHLLVLYESERACQTRLTADGFDPQAAREIASYLSQATDLTAYTSRITTAFAARGTVVSFFEIDQAAEYLPIFQEKRCIVWNLTDGIRYYRASMVSSTAHLLGVRTFGSPPQAQHLAQDKFKCIALAQAVGIPTPMTTLCHNGRYLTPTDHLKSEPPFFVKPNTLGAKIGIFSDAKCPTLDQAADLSRRIYARYRDEVVVQQFIPGYDVRVSFMNAAGSQPKLGIYQLANVKQGETGGEFMTMNDNWTLSAARTEGEKDVASPFQQPAAFQPRMVQLRHQPKGQIIADQIEAAVWQMVEVTGLKDYFSFDFRVTPQGEIYFLEFEVCPAVTIYDFQTYLEESYGVDLPTALVQAITF